MVGEDLQGASPQGLKRALQTLDHLAQLFR